MGAAADARGSPAPAALLRAASDLCERRGLRLTPIRQQVLELILAAAEPPTAYALLDGLRAAGMNAQPPTVYRALTFLTENGLVHRVQSMNAFAACIDPAHPHPHQHFICGTCGTVTEMTVGEIERAISTAAASVGFVIASQSVEVTGTCRQCIEGV